MKKIILLLLVVLIIVGGYIGYPYYKAYTVSSVKSNIESYQPNRIEVKEGTKVGEMGAILEKEGIVTNGADFNFLAKFKNNDQIVFPGTTLNINKANWKTTNDILNTIVFEAKNYNEITYLEYNNVRSIADAIGKMTKNIELDSVSLASYLLDPKISKSLGFDEMTYATFFIPIKMEVYKDISKEEVLEKLKKYYKDFWNADRKAKAQALGYSQSEITILASIVYEEQKVKFDEQPKIAGLYLNRLKKNWKLQADPTVKYGIGDPTIKRLLYKHLEYDSPYNTYIYAGLPPGPISFPEPQTINAVLNYDKHEYMFMCAKPEYSGYHNFSKTLSQHNVFAKEYQKWLNSEGIK